MNADHEDNLREELGPIPEGWLAVRFASVREWLQYGTSIRCRREPTEFPVLRIPNIELGQVNTSDLKFGELSTSEASQYRLEEGDLIFIRTNGVVKRLGSCAVYENQPENALFASYLIRARLKLERVDPHFAAYFFASERGNRIIAGRATPAADGKFNLNTGTIDDLPLPLPPTLDEQREIVSALASVHDAIKLQNQSLAVSRSLKRAAMRVLFTKGLRGEAQKDSEIGEVPDGWKLVPISALGQVVTGNTPPTKDASNYDGGSIPFVAPGDVEHGCHIRATAKQITDKGLATVRPIPSGTTCFVCIGSTIGKVGFVLEEISATNQQINSIIPSSDFVPKYIFYLMTYWSDYVRKQASPSPVPILSKGAFERIEIYTSVNRDEQREIATMLDAIDRKIDLHKRKRTVLDELFKALLHKLMTGEIRVADLDLSALKPVKETGVAA